MRWPPARAALALGALFVVALGLRIAWLAEADTAAPSLADPKYYHVTAQNLADGRGYSVAVDERGFVAGPASESTAFWPPGYPFALAGVYALAGADERHAQVFNAIVGALTVVPVFFIGYALRRRAITSTHGALPAIGDREVVGLVAAALFALMPSLVYWTSSLFTEPLFALGVAATLALALQARERRAVAWAFGVGLALGVTALVRSQGLVLIVPLAILLAPRLDLRTAVRAMAPVTIACAAVIAPWTVRNAVVMGEPHVINSNLCYNLRAAHAPYSTGGSVAPQDLWDEQPGISFRERELLFDDIGCGRAWEYARANPRRELELSLKRAGWLLRSDAAPAIDWAQSLGRTDLRAGEASWYVLVGDVYWYPLLALALLSLLVVPRSRAFAAMWVLLIVWVALHVIFHGEPRYHVPIVPVLAALASATVFALADRARGATDQGA